jgi:hypothetical protein
VCTFLLGYNLFQEKSDFSYLTVNLYHLFLTIVGDSTLKTASDLSLQFINYISIFRNFILVVERSSLVFFSFSMTIAMCLLILTQGFSLSCALLSFFSLHCSLRVLEGLVLVGWF